MLEIFVFLATAIEAGALVFIYRLEKRQLELEEARTRIDLRVDIDFPIGKDDGKPDIWVQNAAAGSCFIEEVVLVVSCAETGKGSERKCYIGGNRPLHGFADVRVDAALTLQEVANDIWDGDTLRLGVTLIAQARVSTGHGMPTPESSVSYDAQISRAGDLFRLARKPPFGGFNKG